MNYKYLLTIVLASCFLYACTKDEPMSPAVDLSAEIQLEGQLNAVGVTTRGGGVIAGTKPESSLNISLFRADEGEAEGDYEDTYASIFDGTMTQSGAIMMNTAQYYQAEPEKTTQLIGLYPAVDDTDIVYDENVRTITFPMLDGSTDIIASELIQGSKNAPMTTMEFSHLLTQVKANVVATSTVAAQKWGKVESIAIEEVAKRCIVTLPSPDGTGDGLTLTAFLDADEDAGDIVLTAIDGEAFEDGIILTQTNQAAYAMFTPITDAVVELTLAIETEHGGLQRETIPEQTYEAGKRYIVNIVFGLNGITITATIEEWEDMPSFTIGVPANGYMLQPGGHIVSIPVNRVNSWIEQLKSGDEFDVSVLWSDGDPNDADLKNIAGIDVEGTGPSARILVTSGKSEGNAVIALTKENENGDPVILWSWHIWVTKYNPNAAEMANDDNIWTASNGVTFMDRNLGAIAAKPGAWATEEQELDEAELWTTSGLLYQWGRKDPFPGWGGEDSDRADDIYPTDLYNYVTISSEEKLTITQTFATPLTFYGKGEGHDWVTETELLNRWGYLGDKTIFDPCPAGWRVPNYVGGASPWQGVSAIDWDNGYDWSSVEEGTNSWGVYPVTGYRLYRDGELSETSYGYYWTAKPHVADGTDDACVMSITQSGYTMGNDARATGAAIRCVQE